MNIQHLLLTIIVAANLGNINILADPSQNNNDEQRQRPTQERSDTQRQFDEISSDYLRRRAEGLPTDPNKTPTDPDVIEHYQELLFARNFSQKRIFFGQDESGKPSYKRIWEHEDNPEFGNVTLAVFHEAAWYKLRFSDGFEIVGTYSDQDARNKVVRSMASFWLFNRGAGGVWDPQRNTIFGGTRDKEIGKKFDEYMERQKANPSKFSKF